ncbi:MAG: TraR/DksA family transcriptional regulator [Lentisphaerae bacterium]|nr:TraR/DksA family transcriptional regulator [Lentisphaerota bacterium]
MAAKKAATKRVTAKKSAAKKKPAPKKKAAATPTPKKKPVAKKAAKKMAVAKPTPKKTSTPEPTPTSKSPAAKGQGAAASTPGKTEQEIAASERDAQRAAAKKRRAAKKAAALNDPLSPRPKKRTTQKLKVIRPGRKKAKKHLAKTKPYRSLTAKQKGGYRDQLLEMRDRVSIQISSLKKESLTRADEVNVEEDGTDAFDRQFALSLASSENEALIKIDEALTLLQDGAFGKCGECGGAIEKARLKALPFAGNCITCQSELEKQRPGYRPAMEMD